MNVDAQKIDALEKLDEEFFKNPIDGISQHFENRLENLVVDQQIIRRRLIDAFTDGAVVELFLPGSQRNFLCQLMEHDRGILEEYEREQGETLCCLTGMDATGEQPSSIVISPLEPRTGNLQIMRAHRIVLRIYLGEHAYEYGTYLKGRTTVNGYQGHVLSMPVVSRTLNNVRLYRVNLSDETSFPVKLSIEGTDVEVNSQALNISAQGIAFQIPESLQCNLGKETVVSLSLSPRQAKPTEIPAVIRNHNKIRKAHTVKEFCGAQFTFPNDLAASYMGNLSATIQRYQIRQNRLFKDTNFTF